MKKTRQNLHRKGFASFSSTSLLTLLAAALLAAPTNIKAAPTIDDPAYSASSFYTHSNSDTIVSFDWDSSNNLYYSTATSSFNFGGFYETSGGAPTTLAPSSSDFSGASVVSIGNNIYYNDTDGTTFASNIFKYGPVGGSPSLTLTSTANNFGLYTNGTSLFITGSPDFVNNHITTTTLNGSGGLVTDPPTDIGSIPGASGPITFDASGDLYYASGSSKNIFMWTAAQIAAAIANPLGNPLTTTSAASTLDYSSQYASLTGGTSMLVYNGQLYLTVTNFGPGDLVDFGLDSSGHLTGTATTVLHDTSSLGELRTNSGNLYLADGNQVFQVAAVPEPSTWFMLGFGALLLAIGKNRLRKCPCEIA